MTNTWIGVALAHRSPERASISKLTHCQNYIGGTEYDGATHTGQSDAAWYVQSPLHETCELMG